MQAQEIHCVFCIDCSTDPGPVLTAACAIGYLPSSGRHAGCIAADLAWPLTAAVRPHLDVNDAGVAIALGHILQLQQKGPINLDGAICNAAQGLGSPRGSHQCQQCHVQHSTGDRGQALFTFSVLSIHEH